MGRKLATFFRQLKHLSFARMKLHINAVHEESGKNRLVIFCDMVWCEVRYGIGYLDYHVFGFADRHGAVRKTYMTAVQNQALTRQMNDPAYFYQLNDKIEFDTIFSDLLKRRFLDLRKTDAAGLREFCAGTDAIFCKPAGLCGGEGIQRLVTADIDDYDALYDRLVKGGQLLIEEPIRQHPDMNRLCPDSVNSEGAPVEFQNPAVLFNAIENYETAENARTAKKIMVALPKEFDLTMQKKVVDEFIEKQITSRGYACSYAIHHDKENMNPHAHILIANRQIDKKTGEWTAKRKMEYALDEQGTRIPIIDPSTGKQKVDKRNRKQWKRINAEQNVLDKKEVLQNMRASWAEVCNQYLDQEHQIDHRSHETRGIDQEPTIHEGYEARAIEASGKASDRCQINRDIKERNELLTQVQEQLKVLEEEIQKLKEQEKGEERNERIRELLRRREAAKSVGGITDGERTAAQSDTDDFLRKLEAQERASKEKRSDHRSEQTTAGIKQYSYRSRKQTFGTEQEVRGRDEQVEEYDEEFEQ